MSRASTAKSSSGPGRNSLGLRSRGRGEKRFSSEPRRTQKPEINEKRFAHFQNKPLRGRGEVDLLKHELITSSVSTNSSPTSEDNSVQIHSLKRVGPRGRSVDKSERFLQDLDSKDRVSRQSAGSEQASSIFFSDEVTLLEEEGMSQLSNSLRHQNRVIEGRRAGGTHIQTRQMKPFGIQALFCAHCANALNDGSHVLGKSGHLSHSQNEQLSQFMDSRPPLSPLDQPPQNHPWAVQNDSDSESERLERNSKGWIRPHLRHSDSSESD